MIRYVYETNADNMCDFFNTSEYKKLKKELEEKINSEILLNKENVWFHLIKRAINIGHFSDGRKIYRDPDECDLPLYNTVNEYYDNKYDVIINAKERINLKKDGIRFSLNGIIGWKAILDVFYKENVKGEQKFIDVYKTIRNPKNNGHLIWPVHDIPTINTERYREFNDRIDYTLFDIKNYFDSKFDNENLKLKKVYFNSSKNATTKRWLDSFKNFKDFIDTMKLNCWCDEDYNIIDISSENMKERIEEYNTQNKYPITMKYIENLMIKISRKED